MTNQVNQVKKDIIVVAKTGYAVLLEIDGRTFDIDCHEAINLSNIFPASVLKKCSSLSTHLKDGNLVFFEKGTKLSEDVTASAKIEPLREETAQHITSQYDQTERDVNRTNMELETRANITEETRKHIQQQVQASKKKIFQTDKKLLSKTVDNIDSLPKERQSAMTEKDLKMRVSMDISPEEFAKKQKALRNNFEAAEEADEIRAEAEISLQAQNNNEESV